MHLTRAWQGTTWWCKRSTSVCYFKSASRSCDQIRKRLEIIRESKLRVVFLKTRTMTIAERRRQNFCSIRTSHVRGWLMSLLCLLFLDLLIIRSSCSKYWKICNSATHFYMIKSNQKFKTLWLASMKLKRLRSRRINGNGWIGKINWVDVFVDHWRIRTASIVQTLQQSFRHHWLTAMPQYSAAWRTTRTDSGSPFGPFVSRRRVTSRQLGIPKLVASGPLAVVHYTSGLLIFST